MSANYLIITLFAVVLLVAACTASQAVINGGFTWYWTDSFGNPTNWDLQDLTIDWRWTSSTSVASFQFQVQSDPVLVGPLTIAAPSAPFMLSSTTDLGGGLYQVSGYAPAGTSAAMGDADLVDFTFSKPFPQGAMFTVSSGPNGYFVMVDSAGNQTTLGPNDIPPLVLTATPGVPEPSSIIALLGGFGALLTLRKRRA